MIISASCTAMQPAVKRRDSCTRSACSCTDRHGAATGRHDPVGDTPPQHAASRAHHLLLRDHVRGRGGLPLPHAGGEDRAGTRELRSSARHRDVRPCVWLTAKYRVTLGVPPINRRSGPGSGATPTGAARAVLRAMCAERVRISHVVACWAGTACHWRAQVLRIAVTVVGYHAVTSHSRVAPRRPRRTPVRATQEYLRLGIFGTPSVDTDTGRHRVRSTVHLNNLEMFCEAAKTGNSRLGKRLQTATNSSADEGHDGWSPTTHAACSRHAP
jgi:hypothetical protein